MVKIINYDEYQASETDKPKLVCQELEYGNVIYFPSLKEIFLDDQLVQALQQQETSSEKRCFHLLKEISKRIDVFLKQALIPYANCQADKTSYFPINSYRKEKSHFLQTDILEKKASKGSRVLSFFINMDEAEEKKLYTADTLEEILDKYSNEPSLNFDKKKESMASILSRRMKLLFKTAGISVNVPSSYDNYMEMIHHFIKDNNQYQTSADKLLTDFPSFSGWAFFSDSLTYGFCNMHKLLKQTFLVPRLSLVNPEKSPVAILERLTQKAIIDVESVPLQ